MEVVDNGEGIENDHLLNIFDPFFSTRFTGRGLGLAAVHGIVRGHKGAIRVNSKVNHGTTITLLFPTSEPVEIPKMDMISTESKGKTRHKILLVDDDFSVLNIMDKVLSNAGYDTFTARSGSEALEVFNNMSTSLDLVVLDLSLSDMTGNDVLEEMIRINPQVRVILNSGHSIEEVQRVLTPGTYLGIINKPFRAQDFLEYIEKHLGKN